ncbi:TPA: hypothetical protein DDW35_01325 [Candidatus Sumerlaeota bacterium]|nr:hypothetical protein [Candidatus Sumerlaeota bacterium]
MGFFSRQTIGLDIGSRVVKAVQLVKKGKKIELDKCGIADIYPNGEKPARPDEQRQAIIRAIRQALTNAKITATSAVSAVAGESVIIRYIQLPEMTEAELKNSIQFQAEEYIPFRVEDVNIDFSVIGRSVEGDIRRMDVLLVCARKDLINDHIRLLQEAGLTPEIIDTESFAFLNCFEMNYETGPDDVAALVNIGGDITGIAVHAAGNPKFSRDISIGGNTITAAIQQRLEVSFSEAETLKLERGAPKTTGEGDSGAASGADGGNVLDTIRATVEAMTGGNPGAPSREVQADRAIQSTLNNLVGEIRRSIQFYEGNARGNSVKRLVLGGGSASLKGLDVYMQRELKLPVEIIDPLRRIPVTGGDVDPQFLRDNKYMLSVVVGLALRKVVD